MFTTVHDGSTTAGALTMSKIGGGVFAKAPTREAMEHHRQAQALAYRCAETVGATLEPGVTEREAAKRMRRFLRENGVDDFFHTPSPGSENAPRSVR
jgi:hypothetical protein